MLRINNIKIYDNLSDNEILQIALIKHNINKNDILNWHISKKSIDARKKDDVHFNYSIDIQVKNEKKYKKLEAIKDFVFPNISVKSNKNISPIIIGSGPARVIFCFNFSSKWHKTYYY